MHTQHPDIHEHGLADNCGECEQAAEEPWITLDHTALADLVARTLRNRFGGVTLVKHGVDTGEPNPYGPHVSARSNTEARAMAVVMTQFERVGSLSQWCMPDLVLYLRDRWHSPVTVDDPMLELDRRRRAGLI